MKAVVFEPAEVLEVRDVPVPTPDPGQVRVRMIASPLNPSDLLFVRGQYGRLPRLPATPGFEGVGVVEAIGSGLLPWLRRGRRVAVLNGRGGNWQEFVVLPAKQAVPVPKDVPDEQAAMFFVNPASALVMIRHVLQVRPGAWLLQTAAGSALGRTIIRLGRQLRFRTINVVRRREQVGELQQEGADAVICTADEPIEERVQALTQGEGVPYAVDAVGGATGSALIRSLGAGGRMLVYGTLAGEPISFDPRTLLVGQKSVEGFWLSEWAREQSALSMLRLFRQIGQLLRSGVLASRVAATYPLEEVRAAVQRAGAPGNSGKVLLQMSGS